MYNRRQKAILHSRNNRRFMAPNSEKNNNRMPEAVYMLGLHPNCQQMMLDTENLESFHNKVTAQGHVVGHRKWQGIGMIAMQSDSFTVKQ